jgi:hypothetical protein
MMTKYLAVWLLVNLLLALGVLTAALVAAEIGG